jgi:hypothetical protein
MTTTSSDYQRGQGSGSVDPLGGLSIVVLVLLMVYAVAGLFTGQLLRWVVRQVTTSRPRRFRLVCWGVLLAVGALSLYLVWMYAHLAALMIGQTREIVFESEHLKLDYLKLLAISWPVWLRTLGIAPFVGVASELFTKRSARSQVLDDERRRRLFRLRSIRLAWKRARRRVPDAIDGMMTLGITIDDADDE